MNRFSKYIDKCIWIFLILSILLLCYLFPYTADDFAWGSESGLALWRSGYRDYSGRYVGNAIVLLLTRSRCLRMLVMTVFIVGMDYLIVKISNCKQYTALIIMALLFAAPKTIFRESVAWTAGFSNYTTSITLFILYIYLITCVFVNQSVSKYRFAVRAASLLLLGYLSAMVVEHVTIMQIILGIGIACYAWIKKDKSRIMCCFYPVGSILGAATMFSNGCYAAAAAGTDFYRNIPTGPEAVYDKMCLQYFDMLGKEMILDNIVLELFVAIVITVLCFQKIGGGEERKERQFVLEAAVMLVDASVMYGLLTRINTSWSEERGSGKYMDGLVNVVFWLALFVFTVFILVEERKKAVMIMSLFGIACADGCLLVVSPINSRCFFAGYVLLVWYCMECISLITVKQELRTLITGISLLSACVVLYMNLHIYGSLCMQDKQRLETIQQAIREKKTEIVLPRFKYEDYIIGYTRTKDFLPFNDITSDLEISYEE